MLRVLILAIIPFMIFSQENFPNNGVRKTNQIIYAFINAEIYINHEKKINNGILIIKEDKILNIGQNISIPENAKIFDLNGFKICPSFIDIYTEYGQLSQNHKSKLSSWNPALNIEFNAIDNFNINKKEAESFIKNGFGLVNTFRKDGIIRGSSALIFLSYEKPHESILLDQSALCMSFDKGTSNESYPKSLMGAIALLRQAYYDLNWYKEQSQVFNSSLKSFNTKIYLPKIFEVENYNSIFRANKIANEFNERYIIKTNGDEYKRAKEIQELDLKLIVPVNFPKINISSDPYKNLDIDLSSLKHADTAPFNIPILLQNKNNIAITTYGSKSLDQFHQNIKKIISHGVSESEILKSITYNPANFLNIYNDVGSIEKGKKACFLIFDGELFSDNFNIYQHWINGKKFEIQNIDSKKLLGDYILHINDTVLDSIHFYLEKKKFYYKTKHDSINKPEANSIVLNNNQISFKLKDHFFNGTLSDSIIEGESYDSLGNWKKWDFLKLPSKKTLPTKEKPISTEPHSEILYPNMAYGLKENPDQASILFKNATIWTNEKEGVLDNCDIAIEEGKILAVGRDLKKDIFKYPAKAIIMDASNKHITSGIIDEHSHIAISKGVNEGTQSVTSEVRIGDVINPDDINIYRQLAGGVTIAQLLHGSANPIGGQSAIIKLRWGQLAEELKYKKAKPFIKFALGENVKQSNWGYKYRTRFPQTRMGVEQIIYDALIRAKEYQRKKNAYKKKGGSPPLRKDLELDALVEVLNQERFITCHSYIQSEILMLMDLADEFNFQVNTFTHILEGYKVADKLKLHGANASTFSDWWAYKYEVNDAIPYNAALLYEAGVTTAINSDDAEMGRRLNQEAAKMIKYGNVSQEEAWKSITLNPAKMLHIDDHVGSLKKDKDADIVIWSSNPLSMYSVVEKTYIDGRCYFSIEQDLSHKKLIKKEKARLLNKLLKTKK